jgi:hypothetical protein
MQARDRAVNRPGDAASAPGHSRPTWGAASSLTRAPSSRRGAVPIPVRARDGAPASAPGR